jgi:chromosome segregation ATPase
MIESFTYAALAERLGCSPEAARAVARRKKWPKTAGNDGRARVQADLSELSPTAAVRPASALLAQIEALQAEVATWRTTATGHRADFEHERDRCDRLTADLMKMTAERQSDQERLAAARAAADRATAELVELSRRLVEITEAREPPQRSRMGRAWGWFLRN